MKQIITIILTLFVLLTTVNSQSARPSKETIRDFSVSFYYKYKFEKNQSLQSCAYLAGNRIGYSLVDIQIAVEKLETDTRFREELLKIMVDLYKADEEFFTLNLISIGMKATNAKELAKYIYQKYEGSSKTVTQSKDERVEYIVAERSAEYIGGNEAMFRYIQETLVFPDTAYNNDVEGTIKVQFVIDIDGTVINAELREGADIGYGQPEEALRVVREMPKWKPAIAGGKAVKSRLIVPITFRKPLGEERPVSDQILNTPAAFKPKSILFTGTKTFCDELQGWKYEVTIKNDSITLKLFPGSANSHYKNKSKPIEIIKGIIVNGKIITKDSPEYLTNRFKCTNGILYEVNNEGDYNDFPECK